MKDIESLQRQIEDSGMADKLRQAADSAEGQRIMRSIDTAAVERAAKQGDMQALKDILGKVLATPEGQNLARKIKQSMQDK